MERNEQWNEENHQPTQHIAHRSEERQTFFAHLVGKVHKKVCRIPFNGICALRWRPES